MTRTLFRAALSAVFAATLLTSAPARADGLAGAYLAATQANIQNDYRVASRYYAEALARDPDNTVLLQNALLSFVAMGQIENGLAIARKIDETPEGSQISSLILLSDAIGKGNFATAAEIFEVQGVSFSPLLDGLMLGWIQLGLGNMSQALTQFDEMTASEAMRLYGQYHKSLALALVGDFESADIILEGDERGSLRLNRGALIAHAQILSQLDRRDDAVSLVTEALAGAVDEELEAMLAQLKAGKTIEFDFLGSAKDGAAEVFFTLASALASEENDRFSMVYGRLAQYLRPDFTDAILLVARQLEAQQNFQLATETYSKVSQDDPQFYSAEIGRAEALQSSGKSEAAVEVLRNLARSHENNASVHMSLGDLLRRMSRFEEATAAYDSAIALIPEPAPNHWFLYYARGITHERSDNWEAAEADFRLSLVLSPDQPLVLNYLGYSLVEKRISLDEALNMIETAVASRPNDGYITDSLGWVLYRLGKYDEAVPHMERSVELVPTDPIINDHLGDVFWAVGRFLEAEFQWRRALSFKPDEHEADRIRRKLEVGLDVVLDEEARDTVSAENGN